MNKIKMTITKKWVFAIFAAAALLIAVLCLGVKTYAGWAFGDYDQDWEDINYTFSNYNYIGTYDGADVYRSKKSSNKNVWSREWESHEFGDYAMAVRGDTIDFYYTRESGSNWDRDLVMKMNFTLYKPARPDEFRYKFQIKTYDGSDNDGKLDHTGDLTDIRNVDSGNLVPESARSTTITGIEYLYPEFFIADSLSDMLRNGTYAIRFDSMQVYDD